MDSTLRQRSALCNNYIVFLHKVGQSSAYGHCRHFVDYVVNGPCVSSVKTVTYSHHVVLQERVTEFITGYTRVGTLIVATIYLRLIQNRYMFRSFTVLQCSHQHCVQPVACDVEVVGYL